MARYLVTGGAGFIGSNLVHALSSAGEDVRVIDNLSTGFLDNIAPLLDSIDFIEGDLREPGDCARAVAGVDYVLHQAAVASVPRSIAEPRDCHENNVTGTLNLLIAASEAGVKRIVYAASSSAYGDAPGECKDETMRPSPLSPYAAAKLAGEHYVQAFAECHGLPGVCLRYFNVFGPRQDPGSPYSAVIPIFIRAALSGDEVEIHGDGLQARDFTFVENNVRANLLAATADVPARGEVYNIAAGEARSVLALAEAIETITGASLRVRHVPPRTGDVRVSRADITRAREALGFEIQCPFDEGLERTIAWYKDGAGAP